MNKVITMLFFLFVFLFTIQANHTNYLLKINKVKASKTPTSCEQDSIPPILVLPNGKSIELLPPYNKVTVFPKDIISSAQDNCTDSTDLIYKLWLRSLSGIPDSMNLSNSINVVDSFEFSANFLGTQEVDVIIYDKQGNYTYSSTYLVISCQYCGDPIIDSGYIEGKVVNSFGVPIDSAKIEVPNQLDLELLTNKNGDYRLERKIADFELSLTKDTPPLLGVTSFDLLLIQKHILGIQPFHTPYQFIAADVDFSGTVSTFDILIIKKILLGKTNNFPTGDSWVFVLSDFEFQTYNPANENYPTYWTAPLPFHDYVNIDFIGIKLGDINDNAISIEND